MLRLILIRGLPGSGKTTFANSIGADVVREADMFFEQTGTYKFDREKLSDAHIWCQKEVAEAMKANKPTIAVSNTFVKRWELNAYYGLAVAFGYQVTEITMSGKFHGSIHDVPLETIERMRESWER